MTLADQTGQATASFTYSPWGESAASASSTYGFAGMRRDTETMLYYDNARYYSPQQGRFISPDPIGVKGGVNIYAYTGMTRSIKPIRLDCSSSGA